MTCFMVIYHSNSVIPSPETFGRLDENLSSLLIYAFSTMGKLVMSWFFTVTGFLLFRDLTFENYFKKIKRRVSSLLIPYVAWQCITAAVLAFVGNKPSLIDFLKGTFALSHFPVDGALWYVYAVFLMSLLSPILLLVFKNKKSGWCIIVLLLLIKEYLTVKNNFFADFFSYGLIPNILYYLPSYLIGSFLGKFSEDATDGNTIFYAISLLLIAFLLNGVFPGYFEVIAIQLIPILILFFSPDIPLLHDRKVYNLSFLTYALHQPVLSFISRILQKTDLSVPLPATLYLVCSRLAVLLCIIGIAAIIYCIFHKKGRFVLKVLTGGRF